MNSDLATSSALSDHGYFFASAFLSEPEITALIDDFQECRARGAFRRAGVGKGSAHQFEDEVRRDEVCWFDTAGVSPARARLWSRLMALKESLNRDLFLGLWDLEGHYAHYPPGGFYRRHFDRFRDDDARAVSIVLYLNRDWRPGDGGELTIYPQAGADHGIKIEPRAGTLVCFLSDRIEHEVCDSKVERRSFAGWFRRLNTRAN